MMRQFSVLHWEEIITKSSPPVKVADPPSMLLFLSHPGTIVHILRIIK